MIHSLAFIAIALASGVAACFGLGLSLASVTIIFVAGLATVGLPHGGLDHQIGETFIRQNFAPTRKYPNWSVLTLFMVAYLLVSFTVIAGWYFLPAFTILAFFVLSAWHFGLEEEETSQSKFSWFHHLGIISRGGAVIWMPSFFRPIEVANLLGTILPGGGPLAIDIIQSIGIGAPVFFVLIMMDTIRQLSRSSRTAAALSIFQLSTMSLMFAVCPVLLSFVVYFIGWHSIKGLIHLKQNFRGGHKEFALSLLPMNVLAVILIGLGAWIYTSDLTVTDATLRACFMGLSALAVPHLVLHVMVDSQQQKQQPTNFNNQFSLETSPRATAC
ncbi:MAG: Brp/Blh family beta-carotene 15,15'-dioxygenase [Planctomycetota bacterium]